MKRPLIPLRPPPTRIVCDSDHRMSVYINSKNILRWLLVNSLIMQINEDRRKYG